MRLIDAHALIDEINDMWQNHKVYLNNEPVVHFGAVIDLIGAASVIEAKPVVRAHWEQVITVVKKIHEYEQEDIQYRCDHCGHIVDDFENYCGGSGAQMFEGVKIPVINMEDVPKIAKEMEK